MTNDSPRPLRHVPTWVVALVVLLACAATAWAGPGDVAGAREDAAGDVATESGGALYRAPDIRSFTAAYLDNAAAGPEDDTVQATAVVDASPSTGVDGRILADRILAWFVDSDGNPATGYQQAAPFAGGADVLVVAFGDSTGRPRVAYLRRFANGGFPTTNEVAINLVPVEQGFGWSQPAAVFGAGRGDTLRVWVEAVKYAPTGPIQNSDRSPDDLVALTLNVPPPPPVALTGAVGELGPTSVSIGGRVDPFGTNTQWFVRYGIGGTGEGETLPQAVSGPAPVDVTTQITGLRPATEYRYQMVARNIWGESAGEVRTFTTASVTASGPPVVTGAPRRVTTTTAELTGTVTGVGGVMWFEWGTSPRFGRRTRAQAVPAAGGAVPVSARISRLEPGRTYHYRVVMEIGGARYTGERATVRATPVGRLTVTGRSAAVCVGGRCRLTALSVQTRGRDARNRVLRGAALRRGLAAQVRCVSRCRLRAPVRLTASGPVARGDTASAVRRLSLPAGAVVEVRVVRRGFLGAVYRVTVGRRSVVGRPCPLTLGGVARCAAAR